MIQTQARDRTRTITMTTSSHSISLYQKGHHLGQDGDDDRAFLLFHCLQDSRGVLRCRQESMKKW